MNHNVNALTKTRVTLQWSVFHTENHVGVVGMCKLLSQLKVVVLNVSGLSDKNKKSYQIGDLQLSHRVCMLVESSAQALEFLTINSNCSGFRSGTNFESPNPL